MREGQYHPSTDEPVDRNKWRREPVFGTLDVDFRRWGSSHGPTSPTARSALTMSPRGLRLLLRIRHSISTTRGAFVLYLHRIYLRCSLSLLSPRATLRRSLACSRRPLPRCALGDFAVSTGAHIGARRRLGAASVHRTTMMRLPRDHSDWLHEFLPT
jgi:hypothetical protein